MKQYQDVTTLNKDLDSYEKQFEQDQNDSVVGTKYEPYFDRDKQKFVDAWVITVDGWPQ